MSGFVPGRDRVTLDALGPERARRRQAAETADERAALDKADLAALEREQMGVRTPPRKRRLLERLLRRR